MLLSNYFPVLVWYQVYIKPQTKTCILNTSQLACTPPTTPKNESGRNGQRQQLLGDLTNPGVEHIPHGHPMQTLEQPSVGLTCAAFAKLPFHMCDDYSTVRGLLRSIVLRDQFWPRNTR